MPRSTLTSKGQITVPKKVREHLHLSKGDRVDFVIEEDGTVRVEPARLSLRELEGALARPGRAPVSLEEMDAAVARRHGERDGRG